MNYLLSLCFIVLMMLCSKALRSLAFGRPDSIALECSICSFLYYFIHSLATADSLSSFLHNDLMRCLVLLSFAFVIAALHRYNKSMCMARIELIINHLQDMLKHNSRVADNEESHTIKETVLDNAGKLANQSIDVWYSQFADRWFYTLLKKADKGQVKSFKKKKALIRWSFADILNSLNLADMDEKKLDDKDFNIPEKSQAISMLVFDLMACLSIIVALELC